MCNKQCIFNNVNNNNLSCTFINLLTAHIVFVKCNLYVFSLLPGIGSLKGMVIAAGFEPRIFH
jgi:hypothetical protein